MKKFKMAAASSFPAAAEAAPTATDGLFLQSDSLPPAVTDELLAAAEAKLGVTLPIAFKQTLRQQNGGFLARCAHPSAPNQWANNHVPCESLPGVWSTSTDMGEIAELVALQQRKVSRKMPAELVLLCGDDHGGIALDYTAGAHAEPSVTYWQKDRPRISVAPDFATFVKGLCPVSEAERAPVQEQPEDDLEEEPAVEAGWGVAALLGPDLADDDEADGSFEGGAEDEDDEDILDEDVEDEAALDGGAQDADQESWEKQLEARGDADDDEQEFRPSADAILPPGKKRARPTKYIDDLPPDEDDDEDDGDFAE